MINKIFIASKNNGKIKEIKSVLNPLNIEVLSLLDRPDIDDIKETGKTFQANALIKAKEVYEKVNMPVLADDSGLEVDFLNGAPGVYSARYAGENATDIQNCEKLLKQLNGVPSDKRGAKFRCVLVLIDGNKQYLFEGICEGKITDAPRGDKGFGYDPLFIPTGYTKTFGELDFEVKNKISHRGISLQKLKDFLPEQID
jgi:XTP/dITP diphosphohydrolase